tara:strand:+ start:58 stop:519 length:462 start_codon:yes stop_codon:yes gene_type:complete
MNIFILDNEPKEAVKMTCDKHVVKMVIESVQMLSTTMWENHFEGPYRPTHKNHPCTIWARESLQNHQWLWDYTNQLGKEYTYRYGKQHKSHTVLLEKIPYDIDLPSIGLTPFPQAMPDEYKGNDPVMAYRKYYINEKADICTWKNREVPSWFW